ncbi:leucine-rich repeat domain-containing protein [Pseudomonas granadensis]|uniref:Leucine-rich repeat domain-containing protein n=1 Tax=Pseudomonas granadensis TaxID=1421430 RepID=A0ABX7GIC9_9PSED|nr:leucine-rich repeat domain-containing protein [Pseudomonas granadensis]QRK84880.1 leucine-rich repeat domain-containing protein [Pseudomonas granadensis]
MAGKPPKIKPASTPTNTLDVNADGSFRPPLASPVTPHQSTAHRLEALQLSYKPDSVAVTPAISVSANTSSTAIDEFARLAAKFSLADYWVPTPKKIGEADAQGIRILKQRQYVAVADDYLVQVVPDAESGLLRATLARERSPSGPLLKRDGETRFWVALESDGFTISDSITAQAAELFHRSGRSVAQLSDTTVVRLLAVSGVNEAVLRDVIVHDRPVPFLLEDTLRRFELDQQVQAEGRVAPERFARFKDVEDAFESDCDENTLRMRRVFPDLPKTAAQAIWRNTSAAERLHMHNQPGMPRQMAEEALVALRDVRLARACEGLYLDSVSSPDSERLALKMMEQLAGWPKVRIEIRQDVADGDVFSAIGDARSPVRHLLIRQKDGYVIRNRDNLFPQGSTGLYSAIWLLLQPAQRRLLGVTDGGGAALQQLLRTQPLPSRQDVSELLGLAPLPVTTVTAQLRQAGHLRGGGDNNPQSTKSVVERVRDLYPQLSDEELTSFVTERLKSDPSGVLTRLEKELATLRDELAIWNADGASPHAQTSEPEDAPAAAGQRQAREQFSAKLQDIWQRKSVSRFGYGDYHFSYSIDFSGSLPALSAKFEYVTELILTADATHTRMGAFLDSFPNVQFLIVTGVKIGEFPPGIFQMRELDELTLNNCSLRLSEITAEGLSRIETLSLLSLEYNPLIVSPHVGFMSSLKELLLHDSELSEMPSGIGGLKKLKVLALQNNNIADVGFELFEVSDTQELIVVLTNNPLSNESQRRIDQYLENSSMDRKIEIRVEEPFSDVESDSESSESGFSTGSESD